MQLTEAPPPQQAQGEDEGGAALTAGAAARREEAHNRKTYWIFTHAVLMSVAWVGLLPCELLFWGWGWEGGVF